VDDDAGRPAVQLGAGRPEVRAKLVPGAQCGAAQRVERVHDLGPFRVQVRQVFPTPGRDTVDERVKDLLRAAGLTHWILLSPE
jgi:hypothetical protein